LGYRNHWFGFGSGLHRLDNLGSRFFFPDISRLMDFGLVYIRLCLDIRRRGFGIGSECLTLKVSRDHSWRGACCSEHDP
jgi:hypothetical protein